MARRLCLVATFGIERLTVDECRKGNRGALRQQTMFSVEPNRAHPLPDFHLCPPSFLLEAWPAEEITLSRPACTLASQAAARSGGRQGASPRSGTRNPTRRPPARIHQPRPAADGRGGQVPRGPVLPPQRDRR